MKSQSKLRSSKCLKTWIQLNPVLKTDRYYVAKNILRSLLLDADRLLPGTKGLWRDLVTFEARIEHEGLSFLAISLVTYGDAFDKGLTEGYFATPLGLKRLKDRAIPALLSGILCNVFDVHTGQIKSSPCHESISLMRQILFFWKKLETPPDRTERLNHAAVSDFLVVASEDRGIAPFRKDHISRISNLVLRTLDEFTTLEGRHGPGAVAEGFRSNQKWSGLLPHLVDLDARLESIGYDVAYGLHRDNILEAGPLLPTTSKNARLVTVPKTYRSLRTITVEPCLNQFVQQALNLHLRDEIQRCSVMSRILTLNSQRPNQLLAIEGSITGDWVTVDLSSASDRLSTELVETVFANRPRFLSAALGCRTPTVETTNGCLDVKMYAGMGNATTFPVQSVTFAILALAAMTSTHEKLSIRKLEALARNVRVFGDDIIIRREHFPGLAEWIMSCGLKLNHKKTLTEGNFRESCGVDAYGGTDVTPVYLRHDPSNIASDDSSFVGVLATCNQLWLRALYTTSDFLRRLLDRVRTLPLVGKDCQGLGYHTHQDLCHGYQRWSETLHLSLIHI